MESGSSSDQAHQGVVPCPAGKHVYGVGGTISGKNLSATDQAALVLDDLAILPESNSVRVTAYEHQTGTSLDWHIAAYALCG